MNEKLEELLQRPLHVKLGILAALLVLIGGGYYYFFFADLNKELSELTNVIEGPKGLRTQIAQKEGIARNLQRFLAEVTRLDAELARALAELPDRREISQLLSRISDKARNAGLEIRLFKPQPEQKREFYAEVPVQIEVTGTFHQVATFFDEVGRLERIVNLDQFEVTDPTLNEDGQVGLKTGVVATSFRFLEESERPKATEEVDKDGGTKKRRRRAGS